MIASIHSRQAKAAGAALGLWIAATAVPLMLMLDPSLAATGVDVRIDWRVVLAGMAAVLLILTYRATHKSLD